MKIKIHLFTLFFLSFFSSSFAQSILTNPIIDPNPSLDNPFSLGQTTDINITALGIKRGTGVSAVVAADVFSAKGWDSKVLDVNDYFEFTITPNSGYKINFISFACKAQLNSQGPTDFAFRSSVDNYTADIAVPIISSNPAVEVTPGNINLSAFQNITTPLTFRLYGYGGNKIGTFSINEFTFNGVVTCGTLATPVSTAKSAVTCSGATANWTDDISASSYLLDVSTSSTFSTYINGYEGLDVGKRSSYKIVGLASGTTYYYRVRAKNACLVSGNSTTQNFSTLAVTATTWNGVSWSNGIPSDAKNITFSGDYSSAGNLNACSCQVLSGNIVINANNTLTVANTVDLSSGTLTLQNSASLIQIGNGTNTGTITVKKTSSPLILDDYTYWSSPTKGGQSLLSFSPNTQTDKFFDYNNDYTILNPSTTFFSPGIGYAIRSPEGISATVPSAFPFQFVGVPNNGKINVPVTVRTSGPDINTGERLIGNPYPSALDADAFINANITSGTGTKTISGTLYFWTHNHSLTGNDYSATDYATYNLSGGVSIGSGTGNTTTPAKYIASGQGFFVEVDAPGTISFTNDMRVGAPNNNFYKKAGEKSVVEESSKIWLNLKNGSTNFSQTLIGYVPNATDNYDSGYDSSVYDEAQPFSLYSVVRQYKLAIQGRSLPFVDTDAVQLGYSINAAGNANIAIDHMEGVFLGSQNVYIQDNLLGQVHDLKSAPYNFDTAVGTFNNRFVIVYIDESLSTEDFENNYGNVIISKKGGEVKIKSEEDTIKQILVFDILGRKVNEKNVDNEQIVQLTQIPLQNQIGIVKVILTSGKVISKKIVF